MTIMGRKVLFVFCLFVAISITLFFPTKKVLIIKNRNGRERVVSRDAIINGFCISYTHSVNKGRVHDFYRIDGDRFIIYKTEFSSYGAGMPEIEETPGAVFTINENNFAMEYERDAGKKFLLAVGVIADHSITINKKEYFLKDFFEAQTSLEFCVEKVSHAELVSASIR